MNQFIAQTFTLPSLIGISEKSVEEHLKLYAGYVNNCNSLLNEIAQISEKPDPNTLGSLHRRFGFEYNGMRNHEIYFGSLLRGATPLSDQSPLMTQISAQWGSFAVWQELFSTLALTRGIGWAIMYYDRDSKQLLNAWIDEQHLGQLQNCTPILTLDMWEHSYVADYQPSGKKQYIVDFFANLNWDFVADQFTAAQ